MAGLTPNEGENLIARIIYMRSLVDRDANLEIGLFTNSTGVDETIALGAITEPTGGGYARQDLVDANWTVTNDQATYPQITFTATGSAYTGSVYGYFIATKAAGGTPRLLHVEIDATGPYTISENSSYQINLQNTVA